MLQSYLLPATLLFSLPLCRILPSYPPAVLPFCRYDNSNHDAFPVGDPSKRAFTYFVLTGGRFIGAAAVRLAVLKFVLSMTASKVQAVACRQLAAIAVVGSQCSAAATAG